MVTTLLRLKLRLLVNTLTKEVWRLILSIIGVLYALGIIVAIAVAAVFLGWSGVDLGPATVLAGATLTLAWILLPLLAFGIDDTLDPGRFSLFTTPTPGLGAGLILAGGVSIPGLLTLGGLVAFTPAWVAHPAAAVTWVVAALLGFLMCLTLARVITTAAANRLRSRRGRDLAAGIGMVLLLGVVILPNFLEGADLAGLWETLQGMLVVLSWTPLGAPWAAPAAMANGDYGTGLAHLLVAAAWLGLALVWWVRILGPAMISAPSQAARNIRGTGSFDLPRRLHRGLGLPLPAAAVMARCLRYWRSDARYFTQAMTILLLGPVLAVALTFAPEAPPQVPLFVPLMMAFLAGWAIHNDTAYDSSAIWMGMSAGTPGRHDRLGRMLAYLVWSLPALIVVTLGIVAYTGIWQYTLVLLAAVLGVYGAGVGFSMVGSAHIVYPVQPPGASPFSTQGMGAFGATILTQTVAMVAILVLAAPTLVTAALGLFLAPVWAYVSIVLAILTTVAALWAGVVWGGRVLEERAPAHLLTIRGWDGH